MFGLPRIYPITDKKLAGKPTHLAIVRELVRGGAKLIQIRDKETPVRELLADIRRCTEHAEKSGALVIVNDRCDLALLGDAAGVHLGQEDLSPEVARKVLGRGAVIGYSTNTTAQVRRANRQPIQYIGFGPIYATSTKPDHSPVVGLAALRRACRLSSHPVAAIGGIDLEHIREVLEAGAASAAVISTLMRAKSIARRMEQLLKAAAGV